MNDFRTPDLPDPSAAPQRADDDIDARFDDAASGNAPPRPDAPSAKSAKIQLDEMTAACSEWVRSKPIQALAIAAGVGFLLGRGGR